MSKSLNQRIIAKRPKNRLTEEQFRVLEASFLEKKKLEPERKYQLAHQLGMPAKQVSVWFQNRRVRWKTQNIELDCSTIQLRLNTVITENMSLEWEVGRLRAELQKHQEILFTLNPVSPTVTPVCTPYDENGSSSLSSDDNLHWQNRTGWEIHELYAHLMGDE